MTPGTSAQGTGIGKCAVAAIFDDPVAAALFAEYAEECSNPVSGSPLPVRAVYETLEQAGAAQCFAAYQAGALAGFAFVLKTVRPDFGMRYATVERMFAAQRSRGEGLGTELMRAIEADAIEAGCEAIYYSAPAGSRLARLLFLSKGCRKTNEIFTKRLP